MQQDRLESQARPESFDKLWCQSDLGNQYQHLAAGTHHVVNQLQLDFRFATAGATVNQAYLELSLSSDNA